MVASQLRERISPYTAILVAGNHDVPWLATGKPDKRRMLDWFTSP